MELRTANAARIRKPCRLLRRRCGRHARLELFRVRCRLRVFPFSAGGLAGYPNSNNGAPGFFGADDCPVNRSAGAKKLAHHSFIAAFEKILKALMPPKHVFGLQAYCPRPTIESRRALKPLESEKIGPLSVVRIAEMASKVVTLPVVVSPVSRR